MEKRASAGLPNRGVFSAVFQAIIKEQDCDFPVKFMVANREQSYIFVLNNSNVPPIIQAGSNTASRWIIRFDARFVRTKAVKREYNECSDNQSREFQRLP